MIRLLLATALAAMFGISASAETSDNVDPGGLPIGKEIIEPEIPTICLPYDYVEVGYIFSNGSHYARNEGHGAGVRFSKALIGNLFLSASGSWNRSRFYHRNVDEYSASAGIGYIVDISDRLHFNVQTGGSWFHQETPCRESSDDFGGYIGPGFRYCLTDGIELYGSAHYLIDDSPRTWDLRLGFAYDLSPSCALTISGLYDPGEDDLGFFAGLRLDY